MEELLARHRKEARDLQARVTQKKKGASKKTRKGVNDECEQLERELKKRHEEEIAALDGGGGANGHREEDEAEDGEEEEGKGTIDAATDKLADLSVTSTSTRPTSSPSQQSQPQPAKKPNRQKARLARRAAEQEAAAEQAAAEAADMPDLKEIEKERMQASFKKHDLAETEIRADGHCLYSAVADQLETLGIGLKPRIRGSIVNGEGGQKGDGPPYKTVRAAAADYIEGHGDEFEPFLEEPLFTYVHKVRDTATWGGQLELLALAKSYGVDINVLQGDGPVTKIEGGSEKKGEGEIWLSYYRHNFGLGEHYNSLKKAK